MQAQNAFAGLKTKILVNYVSFFKYGYGLVGEPKEFEETVLYACPLPLVKNQGPACNLARATSKTNNACK